MNEFLIEVKSRDALLFYFGAANLVLTIAFLVMARISTTEVLGTNAWIKPFKFSLSIGVYAWTMAWFVWYLPNFNKGLFAWTIIILLGFEIIYIAVQAGRGQLSHFNSSTPLYKILFWLMAMAATATSLYTAYVGVLFFATGFPQLPIYYLWGIRIGILLFVIFSFEGFLMGARLSHTVGGADGSVGLPIVNWSVQYGDLRIAHFAGMHALQVLPVLSYYLFRNTFFTVLAGLLYAGVAVFLLILALKGKPLVKMNFYETKAVAA